MEFLMNLLMWIVRPQEADSDKCTVECGGVAYLDENGDAHCRNGHDLM